MTRSVHPAALAAAAVTAILFAVLLQASTALTGGGLVYTIDDPYIHLALAERLRDGFYGINAGEPAAPSSSILFPFLLVPFVFLPVGLLVPLIVNAAATLAAVLVIARLWEDAGAGPRAILVLSVATALAFNWIGLAFTGLEHSLHVLASLAVVCGLAREDRAPAWWFALELVAGPALRYEGLAVSGAALVVLWLRGHRGFALAVGGTIIAIVGGFAAFLMAHGLPPLPSSVLAKQSAAAEAVDRGLSGTLASLTAQLRASLGEWSGMLLAASGVGLAAVLASVPRALRGLALFALLVVAAHLLAGRYGWFARYEVYAMTCVLAAGIVLAREALRRAFATRPALATLAIAGPLLALNGHLAYATLLTPGASRNIYDQQAQMHRLAVDFVRAPVGVNDLGYVAYRNRHYVLDFWGLASDANRRLRTAADRPADWMDRLARAHGVDLAMIYEPVFGRAVPGSWVPLGRLRLSAAQVSASEDTVTFYATRAEAAATLRAQISAWAAGLPEGAAYEPTR